MRNIKAVIQYDGSRYFGFQAQLNPEQLPTVQEALEEAIGGLLKEETRVYSAGRTDRGVHALGQVGPRNQSALAGRRLYSFCRRSGFHLSCAKKRSGQALSISRMEQRGKNSIWKPILLSLSRQLRRWTHAGGMQTLRRHTQLSGVFCSGQYGEVLCAHSL